MKLPCARRLRTVPKANEESVDKDDEGSGKLRKRKPPEALGLPWSKDEIEQFYRAYRSYGRDWKKVSGCLHNRSIEMVETLYNMNKAYLSLPEGAASAAGLIAMMTDHYNILVPSGANSVLSNKTCSAAQALPGPGYGGPSPAKKPRTTRPRVAGNRMPHFLMEELSGKNPRNRRIVNKAQQEESEEDSVSTVAKAVAMTLASASKKTGAPQTPSRRSARIHGSAQNGNRSFRSGVRPTESSSADDGSDGSKQSKSNDNNFERSSRRWDILDTAAKTNGGDTAATRLKRLPQKLKNQVQHDEYGNAEEESSHTEDKLCADADNGAVEDSKPFLLGKRINSQRMKRSRQLFSGDEQSGLDTLATLADLSLSGLLPSPTLESAKVSDEEELERLEVEDIATEVMHLHQQKLLEYQAIKHISRKLEVEVKEQNMKLEAVYQSPSEPKSKKKRTSVDKGNGYDDRNGSNRRVDEEPRVSSKYKRLPRLPRQVSKAVKQTDDQFRNGLVHDECNLPAKLRNKKKIERGAIEVPVMAAVEEPQPIEHMRNGGPYCPHSSAEAGPSSLKTRLTHCLSSGARQWCLYEWFYSAIDLPWFARNEFVEYLNHAGLGHVSKLTRAEWGVIRSSLGKPRRLSKKFLQEEREKLEKYRESVRDHYHELRSGLKDGLPLDLARPLTVGQRVIARHPRTKQIHDGSILTVDRNRCRVQFDNPELGVEFVLDIDTMPVHPFENMSELMRKKRVINVAGRNQMEARYEKTVNAGVAARTALNERLERPGTVQAFATPSQYFLNTLCRRAQTDSVDAVLLAKAAANEAAAAVQQAVHTQPHTSAQVQAREADIQALAELSRALDKKEALLVELRRMNDEVTGDSESIKGSEPFRRQYATVVLQLKEVNKQVSAALLQLRQRNKYQDNLVPPWHSTPSQPWNSTYVLSEANVSTPLSGPPVEEIAVSAQREARNMVTEAVQEMSASGESDGKLASKSSYIPSSVKGESFTTNCSLNTHIGIEYDRLCPPQPTGAAADSCRTQGGSHDLLSQRTLPSGKESIIPMDLIASCVATLLMIQMCTEKHLSSPDVAMILENTLTSLRPHSAQNHQLFKEIEQCLDTIKNQITAQVPVQSIVPVSLDCQLK